MERPMLVTQIGEKREFKGSDGSTIKALDVVLTDGINIITASAFDKTVQKIEDNHLQEGTLVNANLLFYVTTTKSEKGEFLSQRVRLDNYGVLALP